MVCYKLILYFVNLLKATVDNLSFPSLFIAIGILKPHLLSQTKITQFEVIRLKPPNIFAKYLWIIQMHIHRLDVFRNHSRSQAEVIHGSFPMQFWAMTGNVTTWRFRLACCYLTRVRFIHVLSVIKIQAFIQTGKEKTLIAFSNP